MSQSQQNRHFYMSRSSPYRPSGNSRIMLVWENGQTGWHHGDELPWSASQQVSDPGFGAVYARPFDERTTRRPGNLTGSTFELYPTALATAIHESTPPAVGSRPSQFAARELPSLFAARELPSQFAARELPVRHNDEWGMPLPMQNEGSKLTKDDQQKALKMLRKEWYNPTTKSLSKNVSLYYRDLARDPNHRNTGKSPDEDAKRCAICLEDFELRSEVTVTPCNHMFHEDCILPWVQSHGQCPVCRFEFCKPARGSTSSFGNTISAFHVDEVSSNELLRVMRALEEAFPRRSMS